MLHALDHFAPDCVLAVEESAIVEADEELAVGAVRILRARHRTNAPNVRLAAELGGKVGLVGAAGAAAGGVAALRHEAVDHPMKDDLVVKAFVGQRADPRDVARREIGAQPDDDVAAAVEVEDQIAELVGHVRLLLRAA